MNEEKETIDTSSESAREEATEKVAKLRAEKGREQERNVSFLEQLGISKVERPGGSVCLYFDGVKVAEYNGPEERQVFEEAGASHNKGLVGIDITGGWGFWEYTASWCVTKMAVHWKCR